MSITCADDWTPAGGNGNWSSTGTPGWSPAVPNATGATAAYDNTVSAVSTSTITQDIGAGVTVGSILYAGTPAATRSWTINPTNPITLNQDGAGAGSATISHAANQTNDRLTIGSGTLTLADNLLISKTGSSIVANAVSISANLTGTGNVTIENVSAGTGNGNVFLQSPASNFAGSVLVKRGAVTFNDKDVFGDPANVVTLGFSGETINTTIASTSAVGIVPNPVVVASGASGILTLGSTSTASSGNTNFSGGITLNGNLTLTSSSPTLLQPLTISGAITGTGGLIKTGSGVAALTVANSYGGGTTISNGTLVVEAASNLGTDTVGNPILISGGNLVLTAATNYGASQSITITAGGLGVAYTPASLPTIVDSTPSGGVYGINYSGTGAVTDLSTLFGGDWSLGSFTSGTFTGGTLAAGIGSTYRLGGGGGVLTIANDVIVGANALVVGGSGGGTVNLSSANTFTGTTSITNGTVGVSSIGNVGAATSSLGGPALPESAINLGSGGNSVGINYTGLGTATTDRVLNLAGSNGTVTLSNSGSGAINYTSAPVFTGSGARTIQLGNTSDAVGGSIPGLADDGGNKTSVSKAGLTNSTWVLTGNTHTGTNRIDGGVLDISFASIANSYLYLDGDSETQYGVLQIQSNSPVTLARTVSTTTDPANIRISSNSGFAARGSKLTVTLNGGAGLTWGQSNFMGTGTARLVFGSTTSDSQVEFTNDINLNTNDAFQRRIYVEQGVGGDSALLSGVLSPGLLGGVGPGPAPTGMEKLGAGTLILGAANTYPGITNVSQGTLLVNGSTSTGAVQVNASATLGGTGTLGGDVAVLSSGTMAPGASIGTLNASGNVTLNPSSTFAVELNASNADRLNVAGTLTITNSILDITELATPTAPAYVIASYTGTLGGDFANVFGMPDGYELQTDYAGGTQIAIVQTGASTPYDDWALSYGLSGDDLLTDADPDFDGVENIIEFALNGDPTDGASNGLLFARMATVSAAPNVLTLTIAVREDADFAADGNRQTATVDGITYTVEAANNLVDWGAPVVTEVTGGDASTIQGEFDTPDTGWIYKTFRTDGSSATDASDFIRVSVE